MSIIEDGTGTGNTLQIDSKNRLKADTKVRTELVAATKEGNAYNVHSGTIVLSGAGTMLYVQNNEEQDLIIEGMVIALGDGCTSDSSEVYTWKNIDGGDILSDATCVTFKSNRNYGSPNLLVADTYMGKSGGTLTGEQVGIYYMGSSQRLFAEINKVVPKGSSIGISIDPKLTSGTIKAYCVLTCHLQDTAE